MSLITGDDLTIYTNVHRADGKMRVFVDAAVGIVRNYLGYELELKKYSHIIDGNGRDELQLKARPIKEILRVRVNGNDVSPNFFTTSNEFLRYNQGIFPAGRGNIEVVYTAGYEKPFVPESDILDGGDATNDLEDFVGGADAGTVSPIIYGGNALLESNANELPPLIKITVLRIGALLESESGGNIGITGNQFQEGGSRTFVNYTNFMKFLSPISHYRLTVV